MRLMMQGIVLCMCFNMATWMLSETNVAWVSGMNVSVTPYEMASQFDVNSTAGSWSGTSSENFFGYIYDGTQYLFKAIMTTIYAFPYMMSDLGAPYFITWPLYGLWSFIMLIFFIELITGRQIYDG